MDADLNETTYVDIIIEETPCFVQQWLDMLSKQKICIKASTFDELNRKVERDEFSDPSSQQNLLGCTKIEQQQLPRFELVNRFRKLQFGPQFRGGWCMFRDGELASLQNRTDVGGVQILGIPERELSETKTLSPFELTSNDELQGDHIWFIPADSILSNDVFEPTAKLITIEDALQKNNEVNSLLTTLCRDSLRQYMFLTCVGALLLLDDIGEICKLRMRFSNPLWDRCTEFVLNSQHDIIGQEITVIQQP